MKKFCTVRQSFQTEECGQQWNAYRGSKDKWCCVCIKVAPKVRATTNKQNPESKNVFPGKIQWMKLYVASSDFITSLIHPVCNMVYDVKKRTLKTYSMIPKAQLKIYDKFT